MFAGHFGLAAAVKAADKRTPVWTLMLGTQLLDVLFVPFLLTGQETIESAEDGVGGYGGSLIHADYTHSLAGALIIALLAAWAGRRFWGRRSGAIIGLVVFSHWLLDLLVHRPDLPILPGNLGDLPLLGFGLWAHPAISAALEAALIAGGFLLYGRSVLASSKAAGGAAGTVSAYLAAAVMGLLLLGSLLSDMMG
ncbi:permease [Paenibacillus lycopersici]|uniref:Permease n=1 Tax=Paenibacillus lycopersici TaxID=2704462 RepID=A0A6C0FZT0_9BACL|nr:metal-dependent hydrolase [Paenibacillus lycopersici]QHT62606.1 permease [Paenibacillus lycopersici]